MLDPLTYPEKWRRILSIIAQYPVIDLRRQYQNLVIKRLIIANVLAFFLQYVCLMTTTLFSVPTLIWFAPGTACALTFLRGYRVLPGIGLGCFFTYYLASQKLALSCICATVFVTQTLLLTWITRRYINPSLVFYKANKLLAFILCSGILTAIASFTLIWICAQPYGLWPQWWLANFNGVLIVSIVWVTTDTFFTYGGKSFGSHGGWRKTSQWAFAIAFLFNAVIYFNMTRVTLMSLLTIVILQLVLCLGTVSSLFISLQRRIASTINSSNLG